jgi:16S rRNA (uracil1498-N3)-methyltransferase
VAASVARGAQHPATTRAGYLERARAASAHVFVDDLAVPVLADDDRHHLERVLRLRAGESVSVADGNGRWRPCTFRGGGGPGGTGAGALEPVGEITTPPEPTTAVTVGFALTKGDRPEWAVQKLTEIGVDRIVPLMTARSVVRWEGDRAGRHLDRLREVARQAAMQSRRLRLPIIDAVRSPAQVVAAGPDPGGVVAGRIGVALAVPGGSPPSLACPTILVGPEGGWTLDETEAAPATVGLGPTVLRTETAAIVAAVYLCALRGAILSNAL